MGSESSLSINSFQWCRIFLVFCRSIVYKQLDPFYFYVVYSLDLKLNIECELVATQKKTNLISYKHNEQFLPKDGHGLYIRVLQLLGTLGKLSVENEKDKKGSFSSFLIDPFTYVIENVTF